MTNEHPANKISKIYNLVYNWDEYTFLKLQGGST